MILFDGDIIVYRAGFGSDSCPFYRGSFTRAKDLVLHALYKARQKLNDHSICIYLTDSDVHNNARYVLDPTYKQNRKGAKPTTYAKLRQWMVDYLDAEVVTGIEADDALGLRAHEEGVVIASIDKDLLTVPGKHYNLLSGEITVVTNPGYVYLDDKKTLRGHGFKLFCAQMLMGDRADNVKGLRGYGSVKAYKLLKTKTTIRSMYATVVRQYRKAYPGLVYDYSKNGEDFTVRLVARELLDRTGKLLWIQQRHTLQELLSKPVSPKDALMYDACPVVEVRG